MALRRRTLLTTAAAVPLAAAGCTDGFGIGDDADARDPPEYARWVPARSTDSEETLYVYFDVSRLSDLQDFREDLPTGGDPFGETPNAGQEENVDALVGVPAFGAVFVGFALGLQLGLYGFVGELLAESLGVGGGPNVGDETGGEGSPTDESDSELGTVETMLFTGETTVLEGSFDLEAIDNAAERFRGRLGLRFATLRQRVLRANAHGGGRRRRGERTALRRESPRRGSRRGGPVRRPKR
ncbi:hypothetical protein BRD14_01175 [Halobacteriales archaeon SW_5_68_122]|nr:MAG: hypothetical protein BRD14_01175 [Halobacteriales archaeon SW_5_68_122]